MFKKVQNAIGIKTDSQQAPLQKQFFDENFFEFKLQGGSIHTELLIANATITKGIAKIKLFFPLINNY